MKIKYQSTMHADGHYPPMICRVQCRCYWMMQMIICIKINSYARNIKEIKNMDKRQKILIVDDSKFNRDILKEILGETYNYLEAENGNQAIQMIGENIGIDLMLLDINMPQMNGFEVLEIMKRSQCIAETPVIMISSEDAVDTMRKAYELDEAKASDQCGL